MFAFLAIIVVVSVSSLAAGRMSDVAAGMPIVSAA